MDLSVIIVSWNAKAFLLECLQSVILETAQYDTEIVVVDNASTDGSAELVREQFPSVKLVSNETNLGFAKANNIGIRQCTGTYICLINSDVIVKKDCINQVVRFMDINTKIGVLGPRILDADGNIQRSCMGFPSLWNTFCRAFALDSLFPKSKLFGGYLMRYWQYDKIKSVDVINGCFWMVRREALEEVGLLDERFFIYGEDVDWCKRFWDARWKVVYFPDAQAIHFGGASSSKSPIRFYIEMHRANLQYWKKYHGRKAQIGFLVITGLHHMIRLFGELMVYIVKPEKRTCTALKIKRSIASIQWVAGFHY